MLLQALCHLAVEIRRTWRDVDIWPYVTAALLSILLLLFASDPPLRNHVIESLRFGR